MNTMRETPWCNGFWRHFESRGDSGDLKKEVFYRPDAGIVKVKTYHLGGLFSTEKETRIDNDIPGGIANLLA